MSQEFFLNLFSACPYHMDEGLFASISTKVHDVDNLEFCKTPTDMEIYSAIKSMNANGAPGNDGYTGHFYVTCQGVTKADLCAFVYFRGNIFRRKLAPLR